MELIPLVLLIMLPALFFIRMSLDKSRIKNHLSKRGDVAVDITWKIFGKGWFAEAGKDGWGNRIYRIDYEDVYGNIKQAWCKTAMFSGVYISDENIIRTAEIDGREMTDAEKIALLEDELKKLKLNKKGD